MLRIDVQACSKNLHLTPGQYYFIYQPFALRGWENHPFSLGAYAQAPSPPVTGAATPNRMQNCSTQEGPASTTLTFWARPRNGWTRRLRDSCTAAPSHSLTPYVLLEGPYGRRKPLHSFDTVILVAGGTGIAAVVPYILDHAARSSGSRGKTVTSKMRLVWASKQATFMKRLCAQELSGMLHRSDFEASLFVTGGAGDEEPSTGYATDKVTEEGKGDEKERVTEQAAGVEIKYGRPAIRQLVADAADEALANGTRIALLVCGPATMADEARTVVHAVMQKGYRHVEYIQEYYRW